jgi:hypothetical protein
MTHLPATSSRPATPLVGGEKCQGSGGSIPRPWARETKPIAGRGDPKRRRPDHMGASPTCETKPNLGGMGHLGRRAAGMSRRCDRANCAKQSQSEDCGLKEQVCETKPIWRGQICRTKPIGEAGVGIVRRGNALWRHYRRPGAQTKPVSTAVATEGVTMFAVRR